MRGSCIVTALILGKKAPPHRPRFVPIVFYGASAALYRCAALLSLPIPLKLLPHKIHCIIYSFTSEYQEPCVFIASIIWINHACATFDSIAY